MSQNPEHDDLIRSYVSWLLTDPDPKECRPPIDRICPFCGQKHTGPFAACSRCKAEIDAGR